MLNQLNVEYTANGFLYAYNWDLIFKNKIIIEIQGDFWHANPKYYKETDILLDGLLAKDVWNKDNNKRKLVESKGYTVHYLWENDINNMTDEEIYKLLKKYIMLDRIKSIKKINYDSKRYDIGVENMHNFYANDILVHNCQNLTKEYQDWRNKGRSFYATEKLDGSSATFYLKDGEFGVCSRRLELKEDPKNTFWKVARGLLIEKN